MQLTSETRNRILAPIIFAAAALILWQVASSLGLISDTFLPSPLDLASRFVFELTQGPLLAYSWPTLVEALAGSLLAVVVALPLGYTVARLPWFDMAASPYIAASQAIPAIAVAPLLVLWIGYGLGPIAILCAITAFFPMLITTVLGVRGLDRDVLDAARLDGASWFQLLRWIEIPLALPSMLAGVRAGITLSITGAVVGEFTMGGKGLGMLLTLYRDANDTEGMFATLVMLAILAVGLFTVIRLLEALLNARSRSRNDPSAQVVDDADPVVSALPRHGRAKATITTEPGL